MKSILDKTFRYTNSVNTDLHKKFAEIRRAMAKDKDKQADTATVTPFRKQK